MGAVSPGYYADMIVLNDLDSLPVDMVFYRGKLVARGGQPLFSPPDSEKGLSHTVHVKPFDISALRIPLSRRNDPIIEVVPGQIITRKIREEAKVSGGQVVPNSEQDILKLVVVERHQATGNIGRALVKGFGLRKGAMASSVAHDSHNIVAVGTNDRDIYTAVKEVERLGGGLVIANQSNVLSSLPLPIAGLLSDLPFEVVAAKLEDLQKAATNMGTKLTSPFATLSFLALPVIPELRLTDRGLVDVTEFRLLG
jgi:adenine deaminase